VSAAITFDFHNTLVRCDQWFQLEIRTLPAVVAGHLSTRRIIPDASTLTAAYRGLRAEIMAHGREVDAVDGVQETFRRAGATVTSAEIRPIIDEVMATAMEEAELLPGAQSTISFLRDNGVPLGVVSSAVHHQSLEWALSRLGVAQEFLAVVSSARAGFYKSRPEIYNCALETLGARPERSVHVGDSYRFDHLAGQQAGLATVWLRDTAAEARGDGIAPDLELTTLEGAGPDIFTLFRSRRGDQRAD
jgi:HAD superfamily hydrolase (TIGR01509 family)